MYWKDIGNIWEIHLHQLERYGKYMGNIWEYIEDVGNTQNIYLLIIVIYVCVTCLKELFIH